MPFCCLKIGVYPSWNIQLPNCDMISVFQASSYVGCFAYKPVTHTHTHTHTHAHTHTHPGYLWQVPLPSTSPFVSIQRSPSLRKLPWDFHAKRGSFPDVLPFAHLYLSTFTKLLQNSLFIHLLIFGCSLSFLLPGLSLVEVSQDYSVVVVHRFLIAMAYFVAEHGL